MPHNKRLLVLKFNDIYVIYWDGHQFVSPFFFTKHRSANTQRPTIQHQSHENRADVNKQSLTQTYHAIFRYNSRQKKRKQKGCQVALI